MKKICFVTSARSEYGLIKWIMKDLQTKNNIQLQLIVTGGHLLKSQGHTIDAIKEDGFRIDATIDSNLDISTMETIAESMGRMAEKFATVFEQLKPDILVVLGDRYELLPITNTAFVMRIPIAHISGGDVTEGAIDDGVRNSVTMLATYHFPGTVDSAKNIERMRGSNKNIWTVGEPGLDAFNRLSVMTRQELADNLDLDVSKKWILMTYHSETRKSLEYNLSAVKNCILALDKLESFQTVITYSNADFGGEQINEYLSNVSSEDSEKFKQIPSLGQLRYISFMKQASLVIGNSSSGIVEAPVAHVPVVNIGDRQKGRYQCNNIVQSGISVEDIEKSINIALNKKINEDDLYYWGDGKTSEKIVKVLSEA